MERVSILLNWSFILHMHLLIAVCGEYISQEPFGTLASTVYPKKYAHGFVVLCFVVVMQSFIMNSHEVFIHIHQGCFAGTGAIVRLPQCQWSKPDGYGKISQCITTTKHSKAKTVCIFLGIYWTHFYRIRRKGKQITLRMSQTLASKWHCLVLRPLWPGKIAHQFRISVIYRLCGLFP